MEKRFVFQNSFGGVWHIKDTQDDSVVGLIFNSNRGEDKTKAMINVMVNALNAAVERKNGS